MSLIRWHESYKEFVNQKTINPETGRYWFTHKKIRRSFTSIKNALPEMFHYLDNDKIPNSTNGIESFFGHLKGHLNVHRVLSAKHKNGTCISRILRVKVLKAINKQNEKSLPKKGGSFHLIDSIARYVAPQHYISPLQISF